MDSASAFAAGFANLESQPPYAEAWVSFTDGSRLHFVHRVGERWAKAQGHPDGKSGDGTAGTMLAAMAMFRLNAKHLDIRFADGSRWERKPQSAP